MALVVLAAVAGAVVLWSVTGKTYRGEALLGVSPVAGDDTAFAGTGVLRDTGGPTRDVETVARIVRTTDVAREAGRLLHSDQRPDDLLERIVATPVGQSFLVSVRGEGESADEAAALANAFARATLNVRAREFRSRVNRLSARLRSQLASRPDLPPATVRRLTARLGALEALSGQPDPTIQIATAASPPPSPASPGLAVVLPVALAAGLLVAVGLGLVLNAMDPRVRDERQLLEELDAPIAARVPALPRGRGDASRSLSTLPPSVAEAYRALAQTVALSPDGGRGRGAVLVTGVGRAEGATSVALHTAAALAEAGRRTALVDCDLRAPGLVRLVGDAPGDGLPAVLAGAASVGDALREVDGGSGRLAVLTSGPPDGGSMPPPLTPAAVERLLVGLREGGFEFVVFDSAPLGSVADALPLAVTVDEVLVVVRLRKTLLARLRRLLDDLDRHGVVVGGLVIVG